VSGDLTFKETVTGNRITALTHPLDRQAALRKAMFDSVMVTTAYRAGKAVAIEGMNCHHAHFALNQNTSAAALSAYLNWFVALNLLDAAGKTGRMAGFTGGGGSTCLLRTEFDDAACGAMFLDAHGNARAAADYIEIARQALRALLDPANSDIERYRYALLEDATWPAALDKGASAQLGPLLPIPSTHPQYSMVLQEAIGDMYDILWWSGAMHSAGQELQAMRAFLAANPAASAAEDGEFAQRRDRLQKLMAKVVGASKLRFDAPLGMVALYWAAGSPKASGKLVTARFTLEARS